jgi:hypothetical protein
MAPESIGLFLLVSGQLWLAHNSQYRRKLQTRKSQEECGLMGVQVRSFLLLDSLTTGPPDLAIKIQEALLNLNFK